MSPVLPTRCLGHPGSSLGVPVPSDTGSRAVRRIPWTSRDPPLVSPQTQAVQAVRRIPWTSRDPPLVSPQTQAAQAVQRIPWTSQDPPLMSPQTQTPMLSGDPLHIPGSSLGVPSHTGCPSCQKSQYCTLHKPWACDPTTRHCNEETPPEPLARDRGIVQLILEKKATRTATYCEVVGQASLILLKLYIGGITYMYSNHPHP